MKKSTTDSSLIFLEKKYATSPKEVRLQGTELSLGDIVHVGRDYTKVLITDDPKVHKRVATCFERMMDQVEKGVPIYGCNTGYGAQASHVLVNGTAKDRIEIARRISEGIAHIDVSVGPAFSQDIVRGAMLIRINMLLQGLSGVKMSVLEIYKKILNSSLTPVVNMYGGIGASGDLAHNCRVLNAARQMEGVRVQGKDGKLYEAKDILTKKNIPQLILDPKAGLGLVNGDNFSTSLAAHLTLDTLQLFLIHQVAGAMTVEMLHGTDRSFHKMLSIARPHEGQQEIAAMYRYLLFGSGYSYQELKGHETRPGGIKVQDGYSLRGISQYHGVNVEKLKWICKTIEINANSVSDNPLWVIPEHTHTGEEPWQWVSGGNFLAMHMVEVMDSLRKIITQIVKLNDRHLARLVNSHESNGLPPNLSDSAALTQCAFKGAQIQSGMLDVYSSLLSIPVSTFFGVHEEGNQDITAHSLTSGILAIENLRLARYSTAQNLVALAQAVDLLGGGKKLSPKTKPMYEYVRSKVNYVKKERPLNNDIEDIYEDIKNGKIMELVRNKIFS